MRHVTLEGPTKVNVQQNKSFCVGTSNFPTLYWLALQSLTDGHVDLLHNLSYTLSRVLPWTFIPPLMSSGGHRYWVGGHCL